MIPSVVEQLTLNFYLWERRGRGWDVWDYPVNLEPPFKPFGFHSVQTSEIQFDDGRKPTFLSSLIDRLKESKEISNESTVLQPLDSENDVLPVVFSNGSEIKELGVLFPTISKISRDYAEHFLLSLSSFQSPVSFEIIGTAEQISVQLACRADNISLVKQKIQSFFPEVVIKEGEPLGDMIGKEGVHTAIVDCGLSDEFMRPLRIFKTFEPDSLTSIFGALENLGHNEIGLFQILFQSADAPWVPNILRAVRNTDGTSFFIDAPEMVQLAEKKTNHPLFSVVLRLIGQSSSYTRAWEIAQNLYSGLQVFAQSSNNEFIPLENNGIEDDVHLEDVIHRQTHRTGMLLNSEELLGLVHFSSSTIPSLKLKRDLEKTRPVPAVAVGHDFILGENIYRGIKSKVSLPTEHRLRHIHIIGKTGTGKSTLLVNMVKQDVEAGRGVAVLDPHGDLIDRIVELIPEHRINDVILFDPSDSEYPVGFNILEAHSEIEQTVLSSDLVELFRRFSTSWGDQMTAVLANAVTAFVESREGGTLIDLKRFLLESDFRNNVLKQGCDPSTIYFWEKEFPLLKGSSQVSIITRLDAFLRSRLVRNIVSQRGGLNFKEIIESKKIFLAKLSQGIIGEENAYLLGSLACSKFHQVVMGRQALSVTERTPFFCYIDEFQHFATPSMAAILSSSRKFAFGLTVVHQDMHQITDSALANSVISNPSTRICFSLGDGDAQKLETGFTHFNATDLMNLGIGEAIVRVERNDYDFNLKTKDILSDEHLRDSSIRERVVAQTRERYGRKVSPKEPNVSVEPEKNLTIDVGEVSSVTEVNPPPKQQVSVERIKETVQKELIQSVPLISIKSEDIVSRKNVSQHRYLQTLIKKMAEQRGYRATIEKPTPDGGRVDVGLESENETIAVEISVTTGDAQEFHNVEKCLKAGYGTVIACSSERKNLEVIKKLVVSKLTPTDLEKVRFFEPAELFSFLDQKAPKEMNSEQRIKGYRVKVQYRTVSATEKKEKRDSVAQVIIQAMKRIEKKVN